MIYSAIFAIIFLISYFFILKNRKKEDSKSHERQVIERLSQHLQGTDIPPSDEQKGE